MAGLGPGGRGEKEKEERVMMDDKTLVQELRRLECRDNLQCLGCGYEHRCSTHGCAVIRQAVERLERLTAPEPNDPLTLEELREMDGAPVWIERCCSDSPEDREWALVDLEFEMCRTVHGGLAVFEMYGKTWLAYRRKPEV